MQPDQINELATALAKAQKGFGPIVKKQTANAGTFTYKYASLDAVIDAVRAPLSDNGLAFTQILDGDDLLTLLIHTSGQRLEGRTNLPTGGTMQQLGSAITYLRRYALQAMLGIAAEEDDDATGGNAPRGTGRTVSRDRVQDALDAEEAAAAEYARAQATRTPQPITAPPSVAQADINALHAAAQSIFDQPFTEDELDGIDKGMTVNELFAAAEAADIPKARLTVAAKMLFGVTRWKITDLTDQERAALWEEVAAVPA